MRCTQSIYPVPLSASPSPLSVSKYRSFLAQQSPRLVVGIANDSEERNPRCEFQGCLKQSVIGSYTAVLFNKCTCFTGCVTWSSSCCLLPSSTSPSRERAGLFIASLSPWRQGTTMLKGNYCVARFTGDLLILFPFQILFVDEITLGDCITLKRNLSF